MSDKDNYSIDEIRSNIKDLSQEERVELRESLREDLLEEYLKARGEYIDELKENGIILRYSEDSPFFEYCQKHPEDQICQQVAPLEEYREIQRKSLETRQNYLEELRTKGLLDFEVERSRVSSPSRYSQQNRAAPVTFSFMPTAETISSIACPEGQEYRLDLGRCAPICPRPMEYDPVTGICIQKIESVDRSEVDPFNRDPDVDKADSHYNDQGCPPGWARVGPYGNCVRTPFELDLCAFDPCFCDPTGCRAERMSGFIGRGFI